MYVCMQLHHNQRYFKRNCSSWNLIEKWNKNEAQNYFLFELRWGVIHKVFQHNDYQISETEIFQIYFQKTHLFFLLLSRQRPPLQKCIFLFYAYHQSQIINIQQKKENLSVVCLKYVIIGNNWIRTSQERL